MIATKPDTARTVSLLRFSAVITITLMAAWGLSPALASSVPQPPGDVATAPVPKVPARLWTEDFENIGLGAGTLSTYSSASGIKYVAHPYWMDETLCNGINLSYFSEPTRPCPNDANGGLGSRQNLQRLADTLGQHRLGVDRSSDPTKPVNGSTSGEGADKASQMNHVLGGITHQSNSPTNLVEFKTAGYIPLPANNRYLTAALDVADVSCATGGSKLQIYFLTPRGNEMPIGNEPYSVCADPNRSYYASPLPPGISDWVFGGNSGVAGTMRQTKATLVPGDKAGLLIRNQSPAGSGNDHAFDNLAVYDVTPTLHSAFSSPAVAAGGTVDMQISVTNTSERGAKSGWSFTTELPSGLAMSEATPISTTCVNGVASPTANGRSLRTSGDLATGESSCSITVRLATDKTNETTPSYSLCAKDFVSLSGVSAPPSCASVQVQRPALTISRTSDAAGLPAPGMVINHTITAENTGSEDYTAENPAQVIEELSRSLDDATYNKDASSSLGQQPISKANTISWSGALKVGQAVTIRYSTTTSLTEGIPLRTTGCILSAEPKAASPSCLEDQQAKARITVLKSVDPASDVPVQVNQDVRYTLTFTNTGTTATSIDRVEDLRGIIDDAVLLSPPASTDSSLTINPGPGTSRIHGELGPGQTATVRYTARVRTDGHRGDSVLNSRLLPQGAHPRLFAQVGCSSQADTCTTNPVTSWTVSLTPSRSNAAPGDTITYTARAKNTGSVPIGLASPTQATIDLTRALDRAQYNGISTPDIEYAAPLMAWSVQLAIGEEKTSTHAVTVRSTNSGDTEIRSRIIGGSNCQPESESEECNAKTVLASPDFALSSVLPETGEPQNSATTAHINQPDWTLVSAGLAALFAALLVNRSRYRSNPDSGNRDANPGFSQHG